ncbi:MAG: cytochrome c, partial [Chloroflexi bacterium]|nr:cytochrome c [Chloroflexota bacterium]
PTYLAGRELFGANCAQCHGSTATGTDLGPPLVHRLYVPSHHPDFSFQAAVANGVITHHWFFGDMPPVPGLTEADVDNIICYVRTLQRDGGLPVEVSC